MTETGGPATALASDNIVAILLEQHDRIRHLFRQVREADGAERQERFDELRALLAVHEAGEEMILRPVSTETAGPAVADARNHEEDEAGHVLARLEQLGVEAPGFEAELAAFQRAVMAHAESEEQEEFPTVLAAKTDAELTGLGKSLLAAEKMAPTHAHPGAAGSPAAQWTVGPFAGLLDHARDLFKQLKSDHSS